VDFGAHPPKLKLFYHIFAFYVDLLHVDLVIVITRSRTIVKSLSQGERYM
jgi:hypothetical protein